MSFNFKKVGKVASLLATAVSAEDAPQAVKDEAVKLINAVVLKDGQAIYVHCVGHFESPSAQPSYGKSNAEIVVNVVPYIDTPL